MAGFVAGFAPGIVLEGRYRLEEPLGEGGMGTVWVARQIALEREVAVKVLHAGAETTAQRSDLRREALTLAAIHHPAVVEVYDFGETLEGVPFVVMELVRGASLAQRLVRLGSMHADEAVELMLPLLEGLAAVHAAGVVHHDIKPENILLTTTPNGVVPKLVDFGIASARRGREHPTLAPDLGLDGGPGGAGGEIVGTPAYMAPEQARGLPTDARTDVWAVGTVLYELIAGVPPFFAEDMFVMLRNVVEAPPPYPKHARGLDGALWRILMGALRKDPLSRTASATALRQDLERWLDTRGGGASESAGTPLAARFAPTLLAPALEPATSPAVVSIAPAEEDAPVSLDALVRAKLGR